MTFKIMDDKFCEADGIETLKEAKQFANDNIVSECGYCRIIDESTKRHQLGDN